MCKIVVGMVVACPIAFVAAAISCEVAVITDGFGLFGHFVMSKYRVVVLFWVELVCMFYSVSLTDKLQTWCACPVKGLTRIVTIVFVYAIIVVCVGLRGIGFWFFLEKIPYRSLLHYACVFNY